MAQYTFDVSLIGVVVMLLVQAVKAPIKAYLTEKGLIGNTRAKNTFKICFTVFSLLMCFAGACIYYRYVNNLNPFADISILWYTLGAVGASQAAYHVIEAGGRDGIFALIKDIIQKRGKLTDLAQIANSDPTLLAQKIATAIADLYEGSPVTQEDVQDILDHIQ